MTVAKDELESFYNKYFSKDKIENIFYGISIAFVKNHFIKDNISNKDYEKDVFKLILNLIIERLKSEFDSSKVFYESLAAYIFKKHIELIFDFISQELLREIAFSNNYVVEFLKYYSRDIIVVDGKRYKVPELKIDNGPKWNVISMIGIIKTYIKAKEYIYEIESDKDELQRLILSLYIDKLSPVEYSQTIKEEFNILNQKIQTNATKIDILYDSLEILKSDNDRLSINRELEEFKNERLQLREEKASLLKRKINQSVIIHYEELLRKLENIHRNTKAEYKILEQNEKSYQSIKSALTKALLSKKQPI